MNEAWKKYLIAQAHAYRMTAASFDARALAERAYGEAWADVRKFTDEQMTHCAEMAAEYRKQAEDLEAQACQL